MPKNTLQNNTIKTNFRLQRTAILLGISFAIIWWAVALYLYQSSDAVLVWYDQIHIFRDATFADPYQSYGFVHPVWIIPIIYPFRLIPLELSTLIQAIIYLTALAVLIVKYGGGKKEIIVTFLSYVTLDSVLQMNVDWLVVVGMLLPAWLSGPFVLAKPQIGIGYYLGLSSRDWLKTMPLMVIVIISTIMIWGGWFLHIINSVGTRSIGRFFNIAPLQYLGLLSLVIGTLLSIRAFRRKDVPLGIIAWIFFTPYIAAYSLPLILGMVAIKWFRLALIFTVAFWVILFINVGPMVLQSL